MHLDTATAPVGLLGAYQRLMRFLAGTSMLIIVVVMLTQVVARYVFNASLIWAEELCRYILIWQTFLFISMAFQRGDLVAVEMLTERLTPRWLFVLRFLVTIPVVIFFALMVQNGYLYASRFDKQTIPALDFIWNSLTGRNAGLTVIWIYISVAIGMALLLLHYVIALVADGLRLFRPASAAGKAG